MSIFILVGTTIKDICNKVYILSNIHLVRTACLLFKIFFTPACLDFWFIPHTIFLPARLDFWFILIYTIFPPARLDFWFIPHLYYFSACPPRFLVYSSSVLFTAHPLRFFVYSYCFATRAHKFFKSFGPETQNQIYSP